MSKISVAIPHAREGGVEMRGGHARGTGATGGQEKGDAAMARTLPLKDPPSPGPLPTVQFKNNYLAEMWRGSEAGSCLRLIDFCITQLLA